MAKLSVKDLDLRGKKVFVRVDFNVPLNDKGEITDDTRIRASLPTIEYIFEQEGIPILASHLGRPKGKIVPAMSLRPVAARLAVLLNKKVIFAPDCIGEEVRRLKGSIVRGEALLLENLRFHAEEEKNDIQFSKALADLADHYVNDAFGAAHRAHASTEGMARYFTDPACGLLMAKEIAYLTSALENPKRPLLAIIGGAKVSTKIKVIKNLLNLVDQLVVGGGMCFTFYRAKNYRVGKSICENDFVDQVRELVDNDRLYLPEDIVITDEVKPGRSVRTVNASSIPDDYQGVDIGEKSRTKVIEMIGRAGTIVWNGPMGVFEIEDFSHGTRATAIAFADAQTRGTITIAGGGDTVAAIEKYGLSGKISHVSTGGGASLEFLEGVELPGIRALKDISS